MYCSLYVLSLCSEILLGKYSKGRAPSGPTLGGPNRSSNMLNCHIHRFDSLGHIYRFYNRIPFSECRQYLAIILPNPLALFFVSNVVVRVLPLSLITLQDIFGHLSIINLATIIYQ